MTRNISFAVLATGVALAALGACTHAAGPGATSRPPAVQTSAPAQDSLAWAIAGDWRDAEDRARDGARHPGETISFWGLKPNMTVVEIGAGGGYWTDILAPYLKRGGGKLIVTFADPDAATDAQKAARANFLKRYEADPNLYGVIEPGVFGRTTSKPIAAAGSADMVISSRNIHGWLRFDMADKAVADIFSVLKPGGVVVVEQHRGDPARPQDPKALSGYVRQDSVIELFKKGGFELVRASEINANPKDTRDHPFGVWTLPPVLRTAPEGQPADPAFDNARFRAIGESDRMALVFRKPL
jgi:predicted methyltransferase